MLTSLVAERRKCGLEDVPRSRGLDEVVKTQSVGWGSRLYAYLKYLCYAYLYICAYLFYNLSYATRLTQGIIYI